MNYQKLYDNIIEKARSEDRKKDGLNYYENHHIVPICLGGKDNNDNKVLLTFREHYVCHKILTCIYPNDRKLACAFHRMTYGNTGKNYNRSNRDYSYARELIINTPISEETRKKISLKSAGKNNPQYGKPGFALGYKFTDEQKENAAKCKIGEMNPQYGKHGFAVGYKFTDDQKKKTSKAQLKRF